MGEKLFTLCQVNCKYQIVLPKKYRKKMFFKPGHTLRVTYDEDKIIVESLVNTWKKDYKKFKDHFQKKFGFKIKIKENE